MYVCTYVLKYLTVIVVYADVSVCIHIAMYVYDAYHGCGDVCMWHRLAMKAKMEEWLKWWIAPVEVVVVVVKVTAKKGGG